MINRPTTVLLLLYLVYTTDRIPEMTLFDCPIVVLNCCQFDDVITVYPDHRNNHFHLSSTSVFTTSRLNFCPFSRLKIDIEVNWSLHSYTQWTKISQFLHLLGNWAFAESILSLLFCNFLLLMIINKAHPQTWMWMSRPIQLEDIAMSLTFKYLWLHWLWPHRTYYEGHIMDFYL